MTRKLLGVLLTLVLLAGCCPGSAKADDAPVPPPPPAVTVLTLNVHGGGDRHGGGNKGAVKPVSKDVLALVAKYQPTVVGLQELCGKQHRDLRTKLGKKGYAAAFVNVKKDPSCNDRSKGNQAGIAIYVKGKIKTRYVWSLPWGKNPVGTTGRQPRRLLCVLPVGAKWRACVTHLSPHAPDVLNQATKVQEVLNRWAGPVILTGDLNLSKKWVDRMFPEHSNAGEGIDHIVSSKTASVIAVVDAPSSDHDAVFGVGIS